MNYKIQDIGGIGPLNAERLFLAAIATTGDLLNTCATPSARQRMSEVTGISSNSLLEWAHLADLMRINGVGRQYADLLWAAGIRSVDTLSTFDSEELVELLEQTNGERRFSKIVPLERQVAAWISQSKAMTPRIQE